MPNNICLNNYAIYLYYNNNMRLEDYAIEAINELTQIANNVIVVINGELNNAGTQKLSSRSDIKVLFRENIGYDFGGYKDAINFISPEKLRQADELIILNSSVYGPLKPLSSIFDVMNNRVCDFWGISTNKYGFPRHVQSYFLVFKKSLISSDVFYEFWDSMPYFIDRKDAIKNGETKLTHFFEAKGYKSDSFIPDSDNPNIDPLIVGFSNSWRLGVPFIKKSIFTQNWAISQMNSSGQGEMASFVFSQLSSHWKRIIINDLCNNYDDSLWGNVLKNVALNINDYNVSDWIQVCYSNNGIATWTEKAYSGQLCGTTGNHFCICAIILHISCIEYKIYQKNTGWSDYYKDGEIAGDSNINNPIVAIQIKSLDNTSPAIMQAHIEYKGWQKWQNINSSFGNENECLQIESLRFFK